MTVRGKFLRVTMREVLQGVKGSFLRAKGKFQNGKKNASP